MIRAALFAVALFAVTSAYGQVHKCVDAAGKIIYTQDPCPANTKPGSISRSVMQAPAPAPADSGAKGDAAKSSAPKTAAEQEQAFRKRQQDQAKAAKESEQKTAEARLKEENCRNARERLAQYEIGGRQTRIDEKGERYYLEDAQIEQEKARARSDVSQSCK
jgi:hypothetical protein